MVGYRIYFVSPPRYLETIPGSIFRSESSRRLGRDAGRRDLRHLRIGDFKSSRISSSVYLKYIDHSPHEVGGLTIYLGDSEGGRFVILRNKLTYFYLMLEIPNGAEQHKMTNLPPSGSHV